MGTKKTKNFSRIFYLCTFTNIDYKNHFLGSWHGEVYSMNSPQGGSLPSNIASMSMQSLCSRVFLLSHYTAGPQWGMWKSVLNGGCSHETAFTRKELAVAHMTKSSRLLQNTPQNSIKNSHSGVLIRTCKVYFVTQPPSVGSSLILSYSLKGHERGLLTDTSKNSRALADSNAECCAW